MILLPVHYLQPTFISLYFNHVMFVVTLESSKILFQDDKPIQNSQKGKIKDPIEIIEKSSKPKKVEKK